MAKTRWSFPDSENLSILSGADQLGSTPIPRKHNLSHWYSESGKGTLSRSAATLQSYSRHHHPEREVPKLQIRILKTLWSGNRLNWSLRHSF